MLQNTGICIFAWSLLFVSEPLRSKIAGDKSIKAKSHERTLKFTCSSLETERRGSQVPNPDVATVIKRE
ncbi:hypothetical protein KP509_21G001500 [Ceratopteris richardii]|uniref:Secreted protein n=1 Tax=Ceratopteris richardii TaxID=49495 RepID=A0A8T2S9U9_CERRI|nr:hypothetical protein KP509_21G001500 [Ceratopteris richardii]